MADQESSELTAEGRATTMRAFRSMMKDFDTEDSLQAGLSLVLRPTDVVITPYGKSGTTWLQQMAHTLRTRGDLDFDDISRVVPWIEMSADIGIDLNADQKAEPRLFKSHLDAIRIPAGGRYINCCRDPADALYSMYKFMEGWFLEPATVSPDEFARATYLAAGKAPGNSGSDYWTHLTTWWKRRNDPDVLFMAYEQMKGDSTGTIKKVADFLGIDLDKDLLAITERNCSLEFMQRRKDLFDDKLMRERSVAVLRIPPDSDSSKVRAGQVGESRRMFSSETIEELQSIWQSRVTAELGFETYSDMIAVL